MCKCDCGYCEGIQTLPEPTEPATLEGILERLDSLKQRVSDIIEKERSVLVDSQVEYQA